MSFADQEEKTLKQHNGQLSGICVEAMQEKQAVIRIDGGKGVGRVTKPGLDQPVGNAAINHVPREMIEKEVQEVCALADFSGVLHITISVPGRRAFGGADLQSEAWDCRGNFHFGNLRDRRTDEQSGTS